WRVPVRPARRSATRWSSASRASRTLPASWATARAVSVTRTPRPELSSCSSPVSRLRIDRRWLTADGVFSIASELDYLLPVSIYYHSIPRHVQTRLLHDHITSHNF